MAFTGKHDPFLHPFAGRGFSDVFAVEKNFAIEGNAFAAAPFFLGAHIDEEAGKRVHQGRLAGAVRADHPHDLPRVHFKAETVDGDGVFEKHHQVPHLENGRPRSCSGSGVVRAQLLNDRDDACHFGQAQAREEFIEDDHVRLQGDRFGKLEAFQIPLGQSAGGFVGHLSVPFEPHLFEQIEHGTAGDTREVSSRVEAVQVT